MSNCTPIASSLPSDKEARALIVKSRKNDVTAFGELKESHQNLVIAVAEDYSKNQHLLTKLIQEGNHALSRAIQKFNLDGSVTFFYYANVWIKSNIETYISKSIYKIGVSERDRKTALKAFEMHRKMTQEQVPEAEIENVVAKKLDINLWLASELVALSNAIIYMADRREKFNQDVA